ncbi:MULTISPECIES: P-loop NTPase fold protein [unclassified Microcoleus]|uniref:P-loop NTPase fold protein n=1 Tax=unclassified Microcoleus TaxID=2642155 RepID=UPI001E12B0D9|nr:MULTISPECIES: P-loop NTPase fold protein [unclassified Microcoleus]MCC3505573.1 NTPase [Microcoleus sp. PH2017_19_SFW_U_A]MCC3473428.1 NTPase [Microcoleus sp. PH2017_13_LAR_U_A]MCC3485757.1 NTPase [Microcoleus sp. PH2017_14_LAR_D_A]MCC3498119.1 NTPase [Microcoleus sp. PH2017_15_JOR_U_A]MCC3524015.1 NTPase [Microcoleus sp. PH2017_20_SFW_D_A]
MPDQTTSTNNQYISEPNQHIQQYLDYYCELPQSPKFAILLKGKWGCGKTWFINQYCEKLKKDRKKLKTKDKKSLYVSLYGITNYSEIEDILFQQIHPVLGSKGMVIAGQILKGLLKGTLKIDINNDGQQDGMYHIAIPDIDIDKKFQDSQFSLLIFDDLERCSINIENILGYINNFVDSQNLKVVIIANEDEINSDEDKKEKYNKTKEKLIGKTFEVFPDLSGALNTTINQISNSQVKEILTKNLALLEELYRQAECTNLRTLNQVILDFERIFENLPEKAQNQSKLVEEVLELLIIFSIEISCARLHPQEIRQIDRELAKEMMSERKRNNHSNLTEKNNANTENTEHKDSIFKKYQKLYNSYYFSGLLAFSGVYPSLLWWEAFFDKGLIDRQYFEESLPNSKFFQEENAPNWMKLLRYTMLTDREFDKTLDLVKSEYLNRAFEDMGIIKHITGLFLLFSDIKVYDKDKKSIIDEAKEYIDQLKNSGRLDTEYRSNPFGDVYMSIEFNSKDDPGFKEFDNYIKQCQEEVRIQNIPNEAKKILDMMQNNIAMFQHTIFFNAGSNFDSLGQKSYYDYPILKYLPPEDFMKTFLILPYQDMGYIFYCLRNRYSSPNFAKNLVDELDFLKKIQSLLLAEISQKTGKISGYLLSSLNKEYLEGIISNLEQVEQPL